jgi:hypothetical protein
MHAGGGRHIGRGHRDAQRGFRLRGGRAQQAGNQRQRVTGFTNEHGVSHSICSEWDKISKFQASRRDCASSKGLALQPLTLTLQVARSTFSVMPTAR